ncbi:MAG: ATP-binding protein [Candidatus Thiodiazotropha sp.]
MRLWPDSLAGRTLALLLGMTLLLIIGSAILLHDERIERFDERNVFRLLERVTTLFKLINDADGAERQRIIQRASEPGDRITVDPQPAVKSWPRHPLEKMISHRLRRALQLEERADVRVHVEMDHPDLPPEEFSPREARIHELKGIAIAVRLGDDHWLNFHAQDFEKTPPWASKTLYLLLMWLVLLVISGLFIARRMARPMAQLADAAERFGLGHTLPPLDETGPREVRDTIHAFNRMQARLHKHITDRSQMLAAVSHDLRTPITTLRLRAEYIEDPEMREKTLATLEEMEAILSATLSFAKDEAADEQARNTDLAALLQSLVDDHEDLGGDVTYAGPERLTLTCRPVALKRALNNLIDNGLKYGGSVVASLTRNPIRVEIVIEDNGPGIPEDQLEAVITPFYRLESSRSRETGGTGLGLAVAKSVTLAHGGELVLRNRAEGGLQVKVLLPRQHSAPAGCRLLTGQS